MKNGENSFILAKKSRKKIINMEKIRSIIESNINSDLVKNLIAKKNITYNLSYTPDSNSNYMKVKLISDNQKRLKINGKNISNNNNNINININENENGNIVEKSNQKTNNQNHNQSKSKKSVNSINSINTMNSKNSINFVNSKNSINTRNSKNALISKNSKTDFNLLNIGNLLNSNTNKRLFELFCDKNLKYYELFSEENSRINLCSKKRNIIKPYNQRQKHEFGNYQNNFEIANSRNSETNILTNSIQELLNYPNVNYKNAFPQKNDMYNKNDKNNKNGQNNQITKDNKNNKSSKNNSINCSNIYIQELQADNNNLADFKNINNKTANNRNQEDKTKSGIPKTQRPRNSMIKGDKTICRINFENQNQNTRINEYEIQFNKKRNMLLESTLSSEERKNSNLNLNSICNSNSSKSNYEIEKFISLKYQKNHYNYQQRNSPNSKDKQRKIKTIFQILNNSNTNRSTGKIYKGDTPKINFKTNKNDKQFSLKNNNYSRNVGYTKEKAFLSLDKINIDMCKENYKFILKRIYDFISIARNGLWRGSTSNSNKKEEKTYINNSSILPKEIKGKLINLNILETPIKGENHKNVYANKKKRNISIKIPNIQIN